jgi:hypothetical protein
MGCYAWYHPALCVCSLTRAAPLRFPRTPFADTRMRGMVRGTHSFYLRRARLLPQLGQPGLHFWTFGIVRRRTGEIFLQVADGLRRAAALRQ